MGGSSATNLFLSALLGNIVDVVTKIESVRSVNISPNDIYTASLSNSHNNTFIKRCLNVIDGVIQSGIYPNKQQAPMFMKIHYICRNLLKSKRASKIKMISALHQR